MHLCLNSASPVREEGQKRERRTAEERKKNGRREKEKVVAQDALTAMIGRRVFWHKVCVYVCVCSCVFTILSQDDLNLYKLQM